MTYIIVDVPDDSANVPEQLGTKRKFWYKDENSRSRLYKEGRPGTGENWAEKVACELCALLGIPHAHYEFATWKGRQGVVTQNFVPKHGRLVFGNEILAKVDTSYEKSKLYGQSRHTVRQVMTVMRFPNLKPPINWNACEGLEFAAGIFVGYLMLDAWVGNTDRHHQNWGVIVAPILLGDENAESVVYLAPSFDHASCLGRNENDESREEMIATNDSRRSINAYVERTRSALYGTTRDTKPCSTLDAFIEAGRMENNGAVAWLSRLEKVSSKETQEVLNNVPSDLMSESASRFAQSMLELNRERLLARKGDIQ